MAENIIANELSAKQIRSNDVKVNGEDVIAYIKRKIKETELDPVFKTWLSSDSRLSDIGHNEISNYATKTEIPTALTDLTGTITKNKISDFGSYLTSTTTLTNINSNEISNYATKNIANGISVDLTGKLSSIIIEMSKLIDRLGGTVKYKTYNHL